MNAYFRSMKPKKLKWKKIGDVLEAVTSIASYVIIENSAYVRGRINCEILYLIADNLDLTEAKQRCQDDFNTQAKINLKTAMVCFVDYDKKQLLNNKE